jgi:P pilus assembly chaperone PapD
MISHFFRIFISFILVVFCFVTQADEGQGVDVNPRDIIKSFSKNSKQIWVVGYTTETSLLQTAVTRLFMKAVITESSVTS